MFVAARALATYLVLGCVGRGVRSDLRVRPGPAAPVAPAPAAPAACVDLGIWKFANLEVWGFGNPEIGGPKLPKIKMIPARTPNNNIF